MAQDFSLRLITQRASGGDPIVRERETPGPRLRIGRAAVNDVVLADLSIDPEHARIISTAPGRVTVESVGGLPFGHAGRQHQRLDLDIASNPVLEFGAYRLGLAGRETGDVIVTVTRLEDERLPDPGVFSLRPTLFRRRRLSWILGVSIVLLCMLVPLLASGILSRARIHPDQQWSSGPLSRAHAFLEDDCRTCHQQTFVAVRDTACLDCHAAAAPEKAMDHARALGSPFAPRLTADHAAHADMAKAAGLPRDPFQAGKILVQRAFGRPTERCATCHVEHGRPDPDSPDARRARPEKPLQVAGQPCETCHAALKARVRNTDLLDAPDWARHPAFRATVVQAAGPRPTLVRTPLASHPQERSGLTFPHRVHLDPLGGVARQAIALGGERGYGAPLECQSCHQPDGVGFKPIEMERDCKACHSLAFTREGGRVMELPHGDVGYMVAALNAFYGGQAGGEAQAPTTRTRGLLRFIFSPGGVCYDCHTISWTGAAAAPVKVVDVHLTTRWLPRGGFDHRVAEHGAIGKVGKRGSFACADCHKANTSDRASDVLIPDIARCAACHGKAAAQTPAAADAECTSCHSFHTPGAASPEPGEPRLETLRWTQMTSSIP